MTETISGGVSISDDRRKTNCNQLTLKPSYCIDLRNGATLMPEAASCEGSQEREEPRFAMIFMF